MASSSGSTPLHVVGRFDDPHTGAERSLPELALALKGRRDVVLWSDVPVHPYFVEHGVHQIHPSAGLHPRGGMLLIGGVHVRLHDWLALAQADRIALRYNLPDHRRLFEAVAGIRAATGIEPELVFVSRTLQMSVGLPGRVEPSLIRLDTLLQCPCPRPGRRSVTIGRLSRDVIEKHHPGDVAIYRMLAARGYRVRIMGGNCLAPQLGGVDGVELLDVGAESAVDFLSSLDIFFYRTGSFIEPYGRVVLEAMASGLPVVVAADGGFAEQISQGVDGLIVQTQEQALQALHHLAQDTDSRARLGSAARDRAIEIHGPQAIDRLLANYLD